MKEEKNKIKIKKDNRGGVRPGAGRKPTDSISITLSMPKAFADKLRAMSKEQKKPIWKIIEGLLDKNT